jgi:hypothetical protein
LARRKEIRLVTGVSVPLRGVAGNLFQILQSVLFDLLGDSVLPRGDERSSRGVLEVNRNHPLFVKRVPTWRTQE